jgi:adenosine deaminase
MKAAITTTLLALASLHLHAQGADEYLETIRNNRAALAAFFSAMPKGGDLHHHYSGSIYTETYINRVVANDYFINKHTCLVVKDTTGAGGGYIRFSALGDSLAYYQQQLMQKWSVKDYNGVSYPSDKQFFETFDYFRVTSNDSLKQGLQELKNRAVKENVSYIETMFKGIPCNISMNKIGKYTVQLQDAQAARDGARTQALLQEIYTWLQQQEVKKYADNFNTSLATLHRTGGIDDERFTMRYQNYVVRVLDPLTVFRSLVVAFESAASNTLVVGVNIVAPENHETSMNDYWLHMQMYKFCHEQYPDVQYAMHAGELALGMVPPEELTWHISEAVYTAGAKRIGHGVDIPYETDAYSLLRYMSKERIAVEINLVSNEFILKVKNDQHPISLYRQFGVPIVISTDDAGVLRSNMTEQYVLLAKRYPDIKYGDIKRLVFNSIDYSFIEEEAVKEKLRKDLKQRFRKFEETIEEIDKN